MSSELKDETVNMIPLIDCMFFLILFFMMVTKFTPEEKAISNNSTTSETTRIQDGAFCIVAIE